ncbi:MAG: O-antigen/teichoic acid export membrane protein [Flavobacteriales bacterium]
MGIISKQATQNAISIVLGTLIGAANTIFVLPRVFEDSPDDWGLIKLITAYGITGAQFLCLGAPQIISRYYPRLAGDARNAMITFSLALPVILLLILTCVFWSSGDSLMRTFGGEDTAIENEGIFVLTLMFFQTLFISLSGYSASILKTTIYQILGDLFQKVSYLGIVLLYGLDVIDFHTLLILYTGIFVTQFVALLGHSFVNGLSFNFKFNLLPKFELINYGLYSILDRGAAIVVANLDIIMLGWILGADGLHEIAFYTIAFYMGSVAMIPQKSISIIANPLVSKAIHKEDWADLKDIYVKSSINQLLLGGLIFALVWMNIDQILLILPEKFRGCKWVVLLIGLSKLFALGSGVNGAIIIFSKYFRSNLVINGALVVLTVITNYFFISDTGLNMGINGAALATAITFLVYNIIKTAFVWSKFRIIQINREFIITAFLIAGLSCLYFTPSANDYPFLSIAAKSSLAVGIFAFIALKFKLSKDLEGLVKKILKLD